MINRQITKKHILDAILKIDKDRIPPNRRATKFNLYYNNVSYPPKYVLSVATKLATGKELKADDFGGGSETNNFLSSLGFVIRQGNELVKKKEIKPSGKKQINICTAVINIVYNFATWNNLKNKTKLDLLSKIVKSLAKNTDILVLPAGFLNSKNRKPESIFIETESEIKEIINNFNPNLYISLGIDGSIKLDNEGEKTTVDQFVVTINKNGIVAIARKFHHPNNKIKLAETAFEKESGLKRTFTIKGKKAYLAVCYDVFGISQTKLENKAKSDFILASIHGFDKSGGDSDFARKGLAGASKQWGIRSYGAAVFGDNRNPTNWTSGVKWVHGDASVRTFNYDDIRIQSELSTLETDIGTVYMRSYKE